MILFGYQNTLTSVLVTATTPVTVSLLSSTCLPVSSQRAEEEAED